jgi:hypothetical protein
VLRIYAAALPYGLHAPGCINSATVAPIAATQVTSAWRRSQISHPDGVASIVPAKHADE